MPPKKTLTSKRKRDGDAARGAGTPSDASGSGGTAAAASMLFMHLIYLWSWGFLSLPFCQRIAMHATADLTNAGGRPYEDLAFLGRIGESGKYPGSMHSEYT